MIGHFPQGERLLGVSEGMLCEGLSDASMVFHKHIFLPKAIYTSCYIFPFHFSSQNVIQLLVKVLMTRF